MSGKNKKADSTKGSHSGKKSGGKKDKSLALRIGIIVVTVIIILGIIILPFF